MESNNYDLIIIGNGISANCAAYFATLKYPDFKIAQVSPDFSFVNDPYLCSINSTATISLNGVKKGVSPLGDLLVDAFGFSKEFYLEHFSSACQKSSKLNIFDNHIDCELRKRFKNKVSLDDQSIIEECMILYPRSIIEDMHGLLKNKISYINGYLKNIDTHSSKLNLLVDNKNISCKKVITSMGVFNSLVEKKLPKIKTGHYLLASNVAKSPLPEGVSMINTSFGQLIYRELSHELLISTINNNDVDMPSSALKESFDLFSKSYQLGDFSQFRLLTGRRSRARKMIPRFGPLAENENIYVLGDLYKNGYLLAPYLANKLILDNPW